MNILVAVASKHGSTWEIGETIGSVLADHGHRVAVVNVEEVVELDGFEAVVLGSAVYAGHWMRSAQLFVSRYGHQLTTLPTWLFSSGPVGLPPRPTEKESVDVENIISKTSAREHRIFSGKLDKRQLSFAERAIITAVRAPEGDFRSWEQIRTWAAGIARALK